MAKNPYGYPEFIKSTGYGTGAGLKGWNCYHDFHPFIPGVDTPNYTPDEIEQMNAEENIKRKFGDKEYTAYEATQRQRELERVMRKYGEESHLLELGGADEDTVLATKVRYQTASQEYAAFSKAMGLPQQRERIRNGMESLAQYAQTAQKPLDFSGESGIINIGMVRKSNPNKVEPMPKKQLFRISKNFKKQGGIIQVNDETDKYLESRHAEAVTYDAKTILLHSSPSRASVFEELIHATQYKLGQNDGSLQSRLECEISAQQKLLRNAKAYKLTQSEIEQTRKALEAYQSELNEYFKNGGAHDV